jgi:hypothetical protein
MILISYKLNIWIILIYYLFWGICNLFRSRQLMYFTKLSVDMTSISEKEFLIWRFKNFNPGLNIFYSSNTRTYLHTWLLKSVQKVLDSKQSYAYWNCFDWTCHLNNWLCHIFGNISYLSFMRSALWDWKKLWQIVNLNGHDVTLIKR